MKNCLELYFSTPLPKLFLVSPQRGGNICQAYGSQGVPETLDMRQLNSIGQLLPCCRNLPHKNIFPQNFGHNRSRLRGGDHLWHPNFLDLEDCPLLWPSHCFSQLAHSPSFYRLLMLTKQKKLLSSFSSGLLSAQDT